MEANRLNRLPAPHQLGKNQTASILSGLVKAVFWIAFIAALAFVDHIIDVHRRAEWLLTVAKADREDALMFAREAKTIRERATAKAEKQTHEPLPLRPLPSQPMFEPITAANIPTYALSRLAHGNILNLTTRFTDINNDVKEEVFVTNVNSRSCAVRGDTVFLLQRKRSKPTDEYTAVRNLLPENSGWTGLTVIDHMTYGMRDIIVTGWNGCQRLTWDGPTQHYAIDETPPSPDQCFVAKKNAWNISQDRARYARLFDND